MDGIAFAVADYLYFDVTGPCEIFLKIKSVIAECGFRLRPGG